uniref:Histidine acid phosphatase family protein n=1 Tax=Caenorhabditis tropicalis TaxID=1561998 RepID=A0A1I7TF80_9PELO
MLISLLISVNIVSTLSLSEDGFDLVFVQAFWRHGDRAPQYPFRNDKFTEEDWKHIGSGIGQLTYKGVRQQIKLGESIRKRYIENGFLPERFDEDVVKFRSTNRNRTIVSAEANFLGMYPNEGKVTLPITVPSDYENDCVNNVMCKCQRRDILQIMAKELEEYKEIVQNPTTISLYSKLSELAGETINAENFWRIPDTLRCEKESFPDIFEVKNPWYSEELMEELESMNRKINRFTSGLYSSKSKKGVDIGKEIMKLRSGPLISEVYERMKEKLKCMNEGSRSSRFICSQKIREMKYYAYSSHDMTLHSLLTAFRLQDLTSSDIGGWPSYASSLFVELFIRRSDRTPYFRLIYRNPSSTSPSEFINITPQIPECHESSFCRLDIFENIYNELKPKIRCQRGATSQKISNDFELPYNLF